MKDPTDSKTPDFDLLALADDFIERAVSGRDYMSLKQHAKLAILASRKHTPELAALAELLVLIDVLFPADAPMLTIDDDANPAAVGAFMEAVERGKAIVAEHLAARTA